MLAKLLVVSVIFVAGLLSLIIARGVFNSPSAMTSGARAAVPALSVNTQPKAVTPSGSPARNAVSPSAVHNRANSLLPTKEETKLKESSELPRKTSVETVTSNTPAAHSRQKEPAASVKTSPKETRTSARDEKLKSTNTPKERHAKERANVSVRRATGAHAADAKNVGSRVQRKPVASTKPIVEIAKDKSTASIVSGGAQRPRRVTP